jgi:Fur family ferric uptake transcriptional regulator
VPRQRRTIDVVASSGAAPDSPPAPGDQAARPTGPQRSTRQRRAVVAALEASDDFRTAQAIHDDLRRGGDSVGLATVYRTLQALVETDEVDVVRTDGGEAAYRRCRSTHHHHLVCRVCGRTVEIEGPAVEQWADAVATTHGYSDVKHTLELFGLCPACR